MQQPEVYIAKVDKLLDKTGNLKDDQVRETLKEAVAAYIEWFNKIAG